ncbi:MAG: glycosyltransferase family 4 protein, partial [Planctomycetota bacterium]|nr:glycosyltransferase family 4 protein [Planctomycetota bacterium]
SLMTVLVSPVPVVVSYCGSDLFGNYKRNNKATYFGRLSCLMSQVSACLAKGAIAKTDELRNRLWLISSRRKCEIIPNGIDIQQFSPGNQQTARRDLGWAHMEPVVVFTDRPGSWVKDPELARRAVEHARRSNPDIRLVVLESIPGSLIPVYFNAADALLLTSRHEGSNNAVKEAMACNLPVIATDCGDTRQRLEGVSPSYVGESDPELLGNAIDRIVTQRLRSNGSAKVQELSLPSIARRLRQSYERLIQRYARRDRHIDIEKAANSSSHAQERWVASGVEEHAWH